MPIYINAISAAPDLNGLFESWLTNASRPQTNPTTLFDSAQALLGRCSPHNPATTGLLFATTKGDIHSTVHWIREQDQSPNDDPPPILSATAQHLAHSLNLQGPAYALSTACSTGLTALIDAAHHLLDGTAENMLTLAYDAATDFVHDGFTALKALSPTQCRPFDKNRDGLSLGSAAAAALLSLTPSAKPLAILSGWALASDAVHMTAPDRHANGLIRAIQNALAMARLQPQDIDVILAHGTGTRYNDSMEMTAIDSVFTRVDHRPHITSVKGLIGHTLGASGLIESALACHILHTQTIPPITNLQTPERPDLNFVIGVPRKTKVHHILKLAAGFGGLNAAIILSHPTVAPPNPNPTPTPTPNLSILHSSFHTGPYTPDPSQLTSPDPLAALVLNLAQTVLQKIPETDRPNIPLILGTTLGCLTADIEFDRSRRPVLPPYNARFTSPAAFARTLPSTLAAELSVKLNLRGPLITLLAGNASAYFALHRAMSLMKNLHLPHALVIAAQATPPENPTDFRAALLLVSRDGATSIPNIKPAAINLTDPHDASLDALLRWQQNSSRSPV